jgi:hypothetical protein
MGHVSKRLEFQAIISLSVCATLRSIPQKHFSDDENGGFARTAAQCTVTYMSSGAQQNRRLQFDKMFLRRASKKRCPALSA